jgi:molecular chaperone DnaJ
VKVKVEVPTKLTERQKQLLREFAELGGEKTRSKTIFEKVKEHL